MTTGARSFSRARWPANQSVRWSLQRLRYLADIRPSNVDKKSVDGEVDVRLCNYTDVYSNNSITSDMSFMPATAPVAQVRRFELRPDDVLVTKDSETPADIAIAADVRDQLPGVLCRYHLAILRPLPHVAGRFLRYALQSPPLAAQTEVAASGVTRFALSTGALSDLTLPVPGCAEQRAIAAFLDRETKKIDALVAKKRRLIELLREKRTALIGHAVTKGLDSYAPMKDSGIEWLGQVPAGWQVMRLSRVTTSRCDGPFGSGLKSEHYVDKGRRVVRLQNIGSGRFDYRDRAFVDEGYYREQLGDHDVLPGDVLIAGLGDEAHPVGRASVTPHDLGNAMVKADCFRFRIDLSKADPQFLALHLTATAPAISVVLGSGATRSRVNMSTMATREIALPPVSEQRAIVSHIENAETGIDDLEQTVADVIERLHEYRSALITAAVTGQIDVRTYRREAS